MKTFFYGLWISRVYKYIVSLVHLLPHPRLKEAEDARTTCVSIENLECSGQLRDALLSHAQVMTELYRSLNKMISDQVNDEQQFAPILEKAVSYSAWYKSRKKVANSMKAAATASA